MALPRELEQHRGEPGFRAYARAVAKLQRELARSQSTVTGVEVLSRKDQRAGWRKFFALEKAADADHWVSVTAVVEGRQVRVELPFRRGLHLPYSVEILLDAPLPCAASLRRNLMRRASWVPEPDTAENRQLALSLDRLKLPDVGWRHESGGIPILLSEGGRLAAAPGDAKRRAVWRVYSAYQGFVVNVRPRVVKYVRAAPELEKLLRAWSAPPPSAARPG